MPSFEIQGTVQSIGELQSFPSGFSKREFVLEVQDGKFPQPIKFECIKDKASLLDKLGKGDQVNVNFDIKGSEHKGRHYINLHAWKITKGGGNDKPGPHLSSLEAAFDNEPYEEGEPPF